MADQIGRGSAVIIGKESTWGTAVARTNTLNVLSHGFRRDLQKRVVPVLNLGGPTHRETDEEVDNAVWTLEALPTYENFGMLLEAILGASATTGPSGSDYTHTYTISGAAPSGLSMEPIYGTATDAPTYEGCSVQRARWAVSSGELMRISVSGFAETHAAPTPATAPSLGSGQTYMRASHGGTFDFNSNNIQCSSFEVEVQTGVASPRKIGSAAVTAPSRSVAEITGQITLIFQDWTQHTEFVSDTQGDGSIVFTSGSLTCTFNLQNMKWTGASQPVSSHGLISQTLQFRCLGDGTNHGLSVVVVNTNSSATAN